MRLFCEAIVVLAVNTAVLRKFCVSSRSITSLIFVSTAKPGMNQDDFLAIMSVTLRNSERFGLTGLLVCNGFNFMQYIEGERSSVRDRMYYIGQDDRHSGVTILYQQESESRQFANIYFAGRHFPSIQGCAQSDLPKILADVSMPEMARTLFRSFGSLGLQPSG
ncbi:Sensors of blue-light using FAD [Sphingorhabdus sp. 109]|nr:Sensors of blue-light using FAD [Sphingorhabdus sp. 109]